MALRIRCPHCRETLVVPSELGGCQHVCDSCGGGFVVPEPVHLGEVPDAPTARVTRTCPRCRREVPPGTDTCRHCHTRVETGVRLPLRVRLARASLRRWTMVVLGFGLAAAAGFVGFELYRNYSAQQRAAAERAAASQPVDERAPDYAALADAYLKAEDDVQREAAHAAIAKAGSDAWLELAKAVSARPTTRDPRIAANRRAAVEALANCGEPRVCEALAVAGKQPELRVPVAIARATLGDAAVAPTIAELWLERLQRRLVLTQIGASGPSFARAAWERRQSAAVADFDAINEAVRLLARADAAALRPLLAAYWDSLGWLAQRQDESMLAALFEAAKPPASDESDFRERVRSARRMIESAARGASPSVAIASTLVLAHEAPQYETLRRQLLSELIPRVPSLAQRELQQLAWALARLSANASNDGAPLTHPTDVDIAALTRMHAWVRDSGMGAPPPLPKLAGAVWERPGFTLRVVSSGRQLQSALLAEMAGGWDASLIAVTDWLDADIGWTPGLQAALDATQPSPNLHAVASAMVVAGFSPSEESRRHLQLWRSATDQPAWVRSLAHTALAAQASRAKVALDNWPADLEFSSQAEAPPIEFYGLLVDAGGAELRKRIAAYRGRSPSNAELARLLAAAERVRR